MGYQNQLKDLGILGTGDSILIDGKLNYIHVLKTHKSLTWSCSNKRTHDFVAYMRVSPSKEVGADTLYLSERDIRDSLNFEVVTNDTMLFSKVIYNNVEHKVVMESDKYVVLHNTSKDRQMNADMDIRNDELIVSKSLVKV